LWFSRIEHEGEVSTILHDEIKEGDMINLAAPVGGFVLENTTEPPSPSCSVVTSRLTPKVK
jgi:ferredoxin-NADP reductase